MSGSVSASNINQDVGTGSTPQFNGIIIVTGIVPPQSGAAYVGRSDRYFAYCYFYDVYYHTLHKFDEFDDIQLVKNIKAHKDDPKRKLKRRQHKVESTQSS